MDKKRMKIVGIVCLVVCAVCIFVAIERYNANASGVRAMNSIQQNSPLGGRRGSALHEQAAGFARRSFRRVACSRVSRVPGGYCLSQSLSILSSYQRGKSVVMRPGLLLFDGL